MAEPYNLSGPEALRAFQDLSIYTTAEACPMVSEVSSAFIIFLKQPTDVEDHRGRVLIIV